MAVYVVNILNVEINDIHIIYNKLRLKTYVRIKIIIKMNYIMNFIYRKLNFRKKKLISKKMLSNICRSGECKVFQNGVEANGIFVPFFNKRGRLSKPFKILKLIFTSYEIYNFPLAGPGTSAISIIRTNGFLDNCDYYKLILEQDRGDIQILGAFDEIIYDGTFLPDYQFDWEISGDFNRGDRITLIRIYPFNEETNVGFPCLDNKGNKVILNPRKGSGRFILPGYSMLFTIQSLNHNLSLRMSVKQIRPRWDESPWTGGKTFSLSFGSCSIPVYKNVFIEDGNIQRVVFPDFQRLNQILRMRYMENIFFPCTLPAADNILPLQTLTDTTNSINAVYSASNVSPSICDISSFLVLFEDLPMPSNLMDTYTSLFFGSNALYFYIKPSPTNSGRPIAEFIYISYNFQINYAGEIDPTLPLPCTNTDFGLVQYGGLLNSPGAPIITYVRNNVTGEFEATTINSVQRNMLSTTNGNQTLICSVDNMIIKPSLAIPYWMMMRGPSFNNQDTESGVLPASYNVTIFQADFDVSGSITFSNEPIS